MFFQFNDVRVNLLYASDLMIEADNIYINVPANILAGKAEDGTWEYDRLDDRETQFTVFRSHPKFLKLLEWIEANTL